MVVLRLIVLGFVARIVLVVQVGVILSLFSHHTCAPNSELLATWILNKILLDLLQIFMHFPVFQFFEEELFVLDGVEFWHGPSVVSKVVDYSKECFTISVQEDVTIVVLGYVVMT